MSAHKLTPHLGILDTFQQRGDIVKIPPCPKANKTSVFETVCQTVLVKPIMIGEHTCESTKLRRVNQKIYD